ncbi:unnamed protein product [Rotaria magnacalcarata]|uniref:Uncharacterized protein n=3 Tax=Rotaria magnacalcarata TaxID=392030 RepID=A0A814I178_9BILA|nr:unnamed protein product [Rotaria magnacalcarata]CAF1682095.1 unnamed protein product [Rotaria magnacalcarata]CAF2077080.1 unnamed protein product [Rotaria magnacalcarata]CAF2086308.1 unnamed protein product [Rotaria magnacalcarata]CAF4046104.1 unnamed protein product [Rotaria magnacalcarata]
MPGTKKKQQRKRNSRTSKTVEKQLIPKLNHRSSNIVTKNFEIFVTDFLIDPCGLPVELRDCVLVDGTASLEDASDNCLSNDYQVLKKIFGNNEEIVKNSVSLVVDDSSKKANDSEHTVNI